MGLTENWMGRTELTRAILRKDTARGLELLEQGAAPCHADYTKCSDLYFAAQESEPEVLQEPLRRGADPDLKRSEVRATPRQNAKYLAPGPIADYMKTYPERSAQEEGV